jgi:hypothetical protein
LTEGIQGTRDEVRKFGILFAVVLTAVAVYCRYLEKEYWHWFLVGAGAFLLTGHIASPLLRPLYLGWMKFAFLLGWINTRILLGIFFYIVLTPIGVVLRLTGKDLLDRKIDRKAASYWKKRDGTATAPQQYERLF